MKNKRFTMTRIDIFSGFLGAGKTTLIKKLIKEAYSGEKLASGLKYEKVDATTNKIGASFEKVEAKYVMFALTAPRSRDASGVAAFNQKYGVTAEVNANPHYFRIVEFEVYES